ncbi:MAG: HAD-IA family hydrolase [Lachnospiraceae bacterium]|nr:HAD-IA family hydrolase [Lachnospiraceae bacterium]
MKYTTVIFDLDGTLLDTLDDLSDSVNYAMSAMNWPLRDKKDVRLYLGNGIRNLMQLCAPEGISEEEFEKAFNIFKSYYNEHNQDKTAPYQGVVQVMEHFSGKGIKMAIVSNKVHEAVLALRDKFFPYVEVAIGDMDGMLRKPAPDSCYKALELLGSTKEEAVYIGDSEVDLLTAKNAELDCITVLWGFRDKDYLIEQGATIFVETPEELEKEVLK